VKSRWHGCDNNRGGNEYNTSISRSRKIRHQQILGWGPMIERKFLPNIPTPSSECTMKMGMRRRGARQVPRALSAPAAATKTHASPTATGRSPRPQGPICGTNLAAVLRRGTKKSRELLHRTVCLSGYIKSRLRSSDPRILRYTDPLFCHLVNPSKKGAGAE